MSTMEPSTDDGDVNALLKVITEQVKRLRVSQKIHGDFHVQVSDDLKQLALLYIMNGEHDKALPLLHQRLVIHEKYGPDDLTAEVLQELGMVYRLHGMRDIAVQHLLRALTLREQCHGKNSLKVAETLNSLAVVYQIHGEMEQAESYQLRSLQVLHDSAEPEDIESEDIPWEVYKRLKQKHGQSISADKINLLKGNMRKCVMDVVYTSAGNLGPTEDSMSVDNSETQKVKNNAAMDTDTSEQIGATPGRQRVLRSHSDAAIHHLNILRDSGAQLHRSHTNAFDESDVNADLEQPARIRTIQDAQIFPSSHQASANTSADTQAMDDRTRHLLSEAMSIPQIINDLSTLQQRVESVKHHILAGYSSAITEVARLEADVNRIHTYELREVGLTMVALVHDINRLCICTASTQQQLPILEGMLEKKSASTIRGWEKRWFKFDPNTFILNYHFSKDDDARGFTPRGGFAVSRISNILVKYHAQGDHFYFDVVVDLSTRLEPDGSRTYELRCEDETSLRYWVETLHYYRAITQKIPSRPLTN